MVLGLLLASLFISIAWSAQVLPPRLASHFDLHGMANGEMTRAGYLCFMAVFGIAIPAVLPLMCWALPYLPESMINMPNREFWLAPPQRPATSAYVFRHALWFSSLQLGLLIAIHLLVVQANRRVPPHLSNRIWLVLAIFLACIVVWIVALVQHFRHPDSETAMD